MHCGTGCVIFGAGDEHAKHLHTLQPPPAGGNRPDAPGRGWQVEKQRVLGKFRSDSPNDWSAKAAPVAGSRRIRFVHAVAVVCRFRSGCAG